jgi:hypothetical protein
MAGHNGFGLGLRGLGLGRGGGGAPPSTLLNDLIAYWKLDEASTGAAAVQRNDSHGANHLTDNGNVRSMTGGKIDACARFWAGENRFFSINDNAAFSTGDIDFTIRAWVMLDAKPVSSRIGIVARDDGATNREYRLDYDYATDRFRFLIFNSSNAVVGTVVANTLGSPATNTWYHVVAWHDATANKVCIKLDALATDEAATTGAPGDSTARLCIGSYDITGNSGWYGYIDEVAFWKRALTPTELATLYGSGAGITYPFSAAPSVRTSALDVVASWWSVPRAVQLGTKTYFCGIDTRGLAEVGCFDHADSNRSFQAPIATLIVDDHCAPCIIAPSGQPPLVFYTYHPDQAGKVYLRRGTVNASWANLADVQSITFTGYAATYAQAFLEPSTNNILLLTRTSERYWGFARSTNYGVAWGTPVPQLFDFGVGNKGYLTCQQSGNVLNCVLYGHPTSSVLHDIYFCTINLATGAIATIDGTEIDNFITPSALPVAVTSLSLVRAPGASANVRLFDVSVRDGAPEVAFCEWTTDSDARYKYAYWSGSAWVVRDLCATGAVFGYDATVHYHGGMSFPNPAVGQVLYLSREESGIWSIEKWQSVDNGANWTSTALAASASDKLIRPCCPVNASTYQVLYCDMRSYGADYTQYDGDLKAV